MFFGESEKAFFKIDPIQECRTILKPFYPLNSIQFMEEKNKRKKSTKQDGEIRIIGVDLALMGGDTNDNTIYTVIRLLPKDGEYERQVCFIESLNGDHSTIQAIKLKQIFYDLECDYVVMDTNGNGIE